MKIAHRDDIERRVHELRALEEGRGRTALSIWRIPPRGWRDIAVRVFRQIGEDRVMLTAAGATFYAVLAMFPAMLVAVSVYGLVTDPANITSHLALLDTVMPRSAIELLDVELSRITQARDEGLGLTAILALLFAIWSANGAMKAMFEAMNIAYNEREKRGFLVWNAITLAFTLGGLIIVLIAVNVIVLIPLALETLGLSAAGQIFTAVLPALVMIALLHGAIAALYRFGPSRRQSRWRWITAGSAGATILALAAGAGFSFYLSNWGDYGATYGSLGAAIGLMMWMYLTTVVIILGAEFNAEIERQTAQDTTIGPDRPLGDRGAVVADTVGEHAS